MQDLLVVKYLGIGGKNTVVSTRILMDCGFHDVNNASTCSTGKLPQVNSSKTMCVVAFGPDVTM